MMMMVVFVVLRTQTLANLLTYDHATVYHRTAYAVGVRLGGL